MRIGNVQNGHISLADPKFVNLPADGSLQRFILSDGDILVSLTGNVGRIGVIKKEHLPGALNQRVARLSVRKGSPASKEFLLFFLYSDRFREELTGAGHGTAQQNVSTKDLVEFGCLFPHSPNSSGLSLKAAGWGVVEGSRVRREFPITAGRIASSSLSNSACAFPKFFSAFAFAVARPSYASSGCRRFRAARRGMGGNDRRQAGRFAGSKEAWLRVCHQTKR